MDQPGGPELRVYSVGDLDLRGTVTFRGARVPVILVFGDATVSATIDVGASGVTPGPGGNHSCGSSAGNLGTGSPPSIPNPTVTCPCRDCRNCSPH